MRLSRRITVIKRSVTIDRPIRKAAHARDKPVHFGGCGQSRQRATWPKAAGGSIRLVELNGRIIENAILEVQQAAWHRA
jgi:hypothetical protein